MIIDSIIEMLGLTRDRFLKQGRIFLGRGTAFCTTIDPVILVRTALKRGEFTAMLLGEDKYQCRPKYSMSPWKTDIGDLLEPFYSRMPEYDLALKCSILMKSIAEIVSTYDGIVPVAYCLLFELEKRTNNKSGFGLPIEEIAEKLRKTIITYGERLVFDNTEGGSGCPHGRYDYLCHLSRLCEKKGCPPFAE